VENGTAASRSISVERYTVLQGIGMLVVTGVAWVQRDPRPVAAFGVACAMALAATYAGRWTADGRFGLANAVTALRYGLVLLLAAIRSAGPLAASIVVAVLVLDGLDGFIARRSRTASSFGARFDTECDALLVLVAGVVLALSGRLGAWILVPGLLRYLYAIAMVLVPGSRGEAPRSDLGRYVFAAMVTSLAASLWPLAPIHPALSFSAALLVVYSFARSSYWSFGRTARPPIRRGA
jgi:phosphatidylglycerophosphate synthase